LSNGEFPGVIRIAKLFQDDIFRVTSVKPELFIGELPKSESVIIAGTIGKSELIDRLARFWKAECFRFNREMGNLTRSGGRITFRRN
jgi:hypothetical protein